MPIGGKLKEPKLQSEFDIFEKIKNQCIKTS